MKKTSLFKMTINFLMGCVSCLRLDDKGFGLRCPYYERGLNGARWAVISVMCRIVI